jgi:poly(3-hydroxyalkanoate) depolymerase
VSEALEFHSITVGAQTLRIAAGGPARAGRVLLLFNGIGASVETIAPFAAEFDATRVVSFDVPGVGGSAPPLLPYRLADIARLAAAVLDALAIDRVDVFGVSWGGAAAQEFALRQPERCNSLTLAATTAGFVMVPGQLNVLLRLLSPRRYLDPAYLLRVGGRLYGGALRTERELLQVHAQAMRGPSRRGYLFQLLAMAGWTSWHRLHRIDLPTLILMGADDPIVPAINGRILASRLQRATVETVDCGHLFVLTRPREVAQRIERFLAGQTPSDPASAERRDGGPLRTASTVRRSLPANYAERPQPRF